MGRGPGGYLKTREGIGKRVKSSNCDAGGDVPGSAWNRR